jgi:hypothetical protein
MRCTCTHEQQLTKRVLVSNRRKVDNYSQPCAHTRDVEVAAGKKRFLVAVN